jgi:hypothetical protein
MADVVDLAHDIEQEQLRHSLARLRAPIPAGEPGECEQCGEDMPRLVDGRCGYCRDGRRPPLCRFDDPIVAPAAPWAAPIPIQVEEKTVTDSTADKQTIAVPAEGEVLAAIRNYAAQDELPLGRAAIGLIELGMNKGGSASMVLSDCSVAELLQELTTRFDSSVNGNAYREAIERAAAAEQQLAQIRGLLG